MATHVVGVFVVCKAYIAMPALRRPSAVSAFHYRGISAPVLEKYDLPPAAYGFFCTLYQFMGKVTFHFACGVRFFYIYHVYFRHGYIGIPVRERYQGIFALQGVVVTFNRRSSAAQNDMRP